MSAPLPGMEGLGRMPVSVETTPLDRDLPDGGGRGMPVYIACPPTASLGTLVQRAVELRRAGCEPIPHIVARGIADQAELRRALLRLRVEAGVERALVLGGDLPVPAGPFQSSRELLATGLFAELGFKAVGLATYPEQHRRIGQQVLQQELTLKLRLAARQGLASWLVSQFSFEAAAIIGHVERLRAQGIDVPVAIGIAGPTSLQSLARFARLCGVKASVGFLSTQSGQALRLIAAYDPSKLACRLAAELAERPELGPAGLHVFSFGGLPKTLAWLDGIGAHKVSAVV